jgi:hypothetical protein
MAEVRKKLTAVQLQQIQDTQRAVNTLRSALAEADREGQRVLTLVFDAQGIAPEQLAQLDEATGELVYEALELADGGVTPAA